jgi:hypothetical protein
VELVDVAEPVCRVEAVPCVADGDGLVGGVRLVGLVERVVLPEAAGAADPGVETLADDGAPPPPQAARTVRPTQSRGAAYARRTGIGQPLCLVRARRANRDASGHPQGRATVGTSGATRVGKGGTWAVGTRAV